MHHLEFCWLNNLVYKYHSGGVVLALWKSRTNVPFNVAQSCLASYFKSGCPRRKDEEDESSASKI